MCHCFACQRRTGSAFGYQARFPRERVQSQGEATEYVRTADSGTQFSYYFCPRCGATLYYRSHAQPDVIAVPVGAFADPTFAAPAFSMWERRAHAWVAIPESAEHNT